MKKFILLLFVCSLFQSVRAVEPETGPAQQERRFLFVVETSSAMSRAAKAAQQTVCELIESGVKGEMRPGDTFGIWTFGSDKLNASFPMQKWSPTEAKKIAELAGNFLKKQRYEKKAQLRPALSPVYSVIKQSRFITVILISSGTEAIRGTPFDREINSIYQQYSRELSEAKIPFVTVLIGFEGRPVAYSVNSSINIQIPQPPILSENKKTNKVSAATNTAPVTAVTKPAPEKHPTSEALSVAKQETNRIAAPTPVTNATMAVEQTSIIQSKEAQDVAIEKSQTNPAQTNISAEEKVETEIVNSSEVAIQITNASAPLTNAAKEIVAVQPIQTTTNTPANVEKVVANDASISPKSAVISREETNVVAASVNPSEPSSTAPVVNSSKSFIHPSRLIFASAGLLVLAAAMMFFFPRSSRKNQPSLISHSINRNR